MSGVYDNDDARLAYVKSCETAAQALPGVINGANELLRGQVRFNDPWDMESCDAPRGVSRLPFYIAPNGDPEWAYMRLRFGYLYKLAAARAITGEESYMRVWREYAQGYASYREKGAPKAPRGLAGKALRRVCPWYVPSMRALDTAIRCYNLSVGLLHMKSDGDGRIIRTLRADNDELTAKLNNPAFDKSNIGVIIACCCGACSVILPYPDDEAEKRLALCDERLEALLSLQLHPCGAHIECSTMYHAQVLLSLLRLIYWRRAAGHAVPEYLPRAAALMSDYLFCTVPPDNRIVMYGDSDSTDISTLMLVAGFVLNEPRYFSRAVRPDDAALLFEFAPPQASGGPMPAFPDVLRLDGENAAVLRDGDAFCHVFSSRPASGHKHADAGSFVYYLGDTPFMIDPGRYTYRRCRERTGLRGAAAHNCALIDGGAGFSLPGAWDIESYPHIPDIVVSERGGHVYVDTGYSAPGVSAARSFISVKGAGLLVIDRASAASGREMRRTLRFDSAVTLEANGSSLIAASRGKRIRIAFDAASRARVYTAAVSYAYGEMSKAPAVTLHTPLDQECLTAMLISRDEWRLDMRGDAICLIPPEGAAMSVQI